MNCNGATGRYVFMVLPGTNRIMNFAKLGIYGNFAQDAPRLSSGLCCRMSGVILPPRTTKLLEGASIQAAHCYIWAAPTLCTPMVTAPSFGVATIAPMKNFGRVTLHDDSRRKLKQPCEPMIIPEQPRGWEPHDEINNIDDEDVAEYEQ
eukprot:m.698645 g.698645  ORF g.698645 m.698645 type:complete len:149 (+) comp22903_c0_seq1:1451-1897(+)